METNFKMFYMFYGVINCLTVGRKSVQVIANPEGS